MSPSSIDFFDLNHADLVKLIESSFSESPSRADQLFRYVYRARELNPENMLDIKAETRFKFKNVFRFPEAAAERVQVSLDGTKKYLLRLGKDLVETVLIKQPGRMTVCVSSQVGCAMDCRFCKTAAMGFRRNLTTSEIIQQLNFVQKDAGGRSPAFSNVVFMGMGEPLHNLRHVVKAVQILNDPKAFNIPGRKITVSTSGLVPKIVELASSEAQCNLAISLNASNDAQRSEIMPVNNRYSISDLLAAADIFTKVTGREVTVEYVMLSGFNDTPADLLNLTRLMLGRAVKINLIPYNENPDFHFKAPSVEHARLWHRELFNAGLNVTIRWSKGRDISAACGQLATVEATPAPA